MPLLLNEGLVLLNEGLEFLDRFKTVQLAEDECLRLAETRELGVSGPFATTMAVIYSKRGDPHLAVKSLTDFLATRPGNDAAFRHIQAAAERLGL
jgi:hypothetical protein